MKTFVLIATWLALVCVTTVPAQAISAELAKKCRDLALKAHPYKLPGTPGPGTATVERDYFSECVKAGGNMNSQSQDTDHNGNDGSSAPPKI